MALGDIILYIMFNETMFLLVVQVDPDLTVGVGGVEIFAERGYTLGDKMFGRDIVK